MSDGEITTYDELAGVIEALPLLVREARRQRRLSLRQTAEQLGVAFSTVDRIERGADYNTRSLPAILRWLGQGSTQ